jgi:nucleotide sugar dehydrogenase
MFKSLIEFIQTGEKKPVVVVQGLGFVGSVMSLVVANAIGRDYKVIGVEQNTEFGRKTADLLNSGVFPIVAEDPKIEKYYTKSREQGNFIATVDPEAYSFAEVIIVDINLDVRKKSDEKNALDDYNVDLTSFRKAIRTIGMYCKPDILVLIETTVPPGTCRNIVAPVLEEELKKRGLPADRVYIGHSYERVMPGPNYIDSIQSFYRVYAGIDEKSANRVESFLKTIIRTDEYPLTRLNNTTATEMAKVLENSYRAMNIGFMVEWSRLAEEAGVNLYEVVNAIRLRPTHSNMMYPGIGVGGYCLTKDPLLASWSRSNLIGGEGKLLQSETAVSINDQMPRYAFEFLVRKYDHDLKQKNIVLLGVSYRGDVGDTRFTPVEFFYNYLLTVGVNVITHDPYVDLWKETAVKPYQELETVLKFDPDIIVISTGHSMYKKQETIELLMNCKSLWIYDTIGLLSETQIKYLQQKHKVIVLGRGDL